VLGALAQAERAALQVDAGLAGEPCDEQLAEARHGVASHRAQVGGVGVDRQLAPAQHLEAFLGGELLDLGDGDVGVGPPGRQEGRTDGVGALGGQREAHDGPEELVGHLDQDPRAVTGVGLRAPRAAMLHPQQRRESLADDAVVAATGEIGHEGDATGVVLELRAVEPGRGTR
jgi:hypothetical protein